MPASAAETRALKRELVDLEADMDSRRAVRALMQHPCPLCLNDTIPRGCPQLLVGGETCSLHPAHTDSRKEPNITDVVAELKANGFKDAAADGSGKITKGKITKDKKV